MNKREPSIFSPAAGRRRAAEALYLRARRRRFMLAAVMIAAVIPLLVYLDAFHLDFLGGRQHMITGVAIIFATMLPFFLIFEKRKPKAREIVLIAVMAALAALGALALFMVTPFQAGTALVIAAGIALGPEAGFLVGAIARFVANFFLGQGLYTPWQMFCWGILGFLAGIVFNKMDLDKPQPRSFRMAAGPVVCIALSVAAAYIFYLVWGEGPFLGWRLYVYGAAGLLVGILIQRKRLPIDDITLPVFGFFTTFIIYGGIMNVCAMVMASFIATNQTDISWESLKLLYASGVVYDGTHALGTAFFLFLFGEKLIRKVERVKIKYGVYR